MLSMAFQFVLAMKLMAVFVHEMGHATMCWVTGGKVTAINVESNEGGVTKYQGGTLKKLCFHCAGSTLTVCFPPVAR